MKKTAIALAAGLLVGAPAFAQSNSEITQLREQLRALQERLSQMEQKMQAAPAPAAPSAPVVTQGDLGPNSWKLPGGTSIALGGQIKAVGIFSNRSPLAFSTADESLLVPTIPLNNTPEASLRRNNWKATAKESRLSVRTLTPTPLGDLTTLVEGDFFGPGGSELSTNGHGFRLRHAWGTLGNFGAGQYWSNAVNLSAVPETVDFSPQIGIAYALRQTQFRYTHPWSGKNYWSVSIENPESVVVLNSANNGANTVPDTDKALDLTGKVHFELLSGEHELAAMARKITTAPGTTQTNKWGYGLSLSGYLPVLRRDRFMYGINVGKDSGRHLGGLIADGVMFATSLSGIDTTAGFLSYKHYWTETMRSNLAYSWISADNPAGISAGTAAGLTKRYRTAHLNFIWAATPQAEFGAEFLRGEREVESGIKGAVNRFLFMGKYSF